MKKEFVYEVNGKVYVDEEVFGKAFIEAKHEAKKENALLTRRVMIDDTIDRYEFFARGGCFLSEELYSEDKAYRW